MVSNRYVHFDKVYQYFTCLNITYASFQYVVVFQLNLYIGTGQDSIAKRVPSLFFTCVTQGIVGSLQAINSFPSERAIMLRERQAGTYQVSAYFAAKTATDTLAQLWPPVLFSVIVYWLIGYQPVASKFFMYTFFMVLDCLTATSLATVGKQCAYIYIEAFPKV
ncbi:hypothetical protein EON65_48375 [archaeon]|nr:MAG: hypothetical protein EON65_48375 [archaeon]